MPLSLYYLGFDKNREARQGGSPGKVRLYMFMPSLLLATRTEARRWCSLRASTCWQMHVRSRSLTGLLRDIVIMGFLERIRCSLRDLFDCHETFPYLWHIQELLDMLSSHNLFRWLACRKRATGSWRTVFGWGRL
jgi:hypothetical protein